MPPLAPLPPSARDSGDTSPFPAVPAGSSGPGDPALSSWQRWGHGAPWVCPSPGCSPARPCSGTSRCQAGSGRPGAAGARPAPAKALPWEPSLSCQLGAGEGLRSQSSPGGDPCPLLTLRAGNVTEAGAAAGHRPAGSLGWAGLPFVVPRCGLCSPRASPGSLRAQAPLGAPLSRSRPATGHARPSRPPQKRP